MWRPRSVVPLVLGLLLMAAASTLSAVPFDLPSDTPPGEAQIDVAPGAWGEPTPPQRPVLRPGTDEGTRATLTSPAITETAAVRRADRTRTRTRHLSRGQVGATPLFLRNCAFLC